MDEIFNRHSNIALQFSGGRDSLACLYLLRPYWHRLMVYWCDTGAAYPETIALMMSIRDMVPNFSVIHGNQPQVIADFGIPSDIVPSSATFVGRMAGGTAPLMQDRYACCARSMMLPTHQRMLDDGVTLVIRGQKNVDRLKSPIRSGEIHDGIEYLFPIHDWSVQQVDHFLADEGVELPRFYEILNGMPDCMTCSAWWDEGAAAYLKRYHPIQFHENQVRLSIINAAVGEHIAAFNKEVAL